MDPKPIVIRIPTELHTWLQGWAAKAQVPRNTLILLLIQRLREELAEAEPSG